jgi:hypothetical protein
MIIEIESTCRNKPVTKVTPTTNAKLWQQSMDKYIYLDFLLRAERGVLLTLEEEVVLLEVEDSPAGVGAVLFPVVGVLGSRSVCDMRSERSSIPPP